MTKILIVEDDADLRRGLTLRLRASGYEVAHAQDGLSAVSVAVKERPDLVLLDIGLPGGDGISVLRRYRNLAATCVTPVVVLSGRDPRVAEPAVEEFDVAGFLTKPVENDVLLDTIERALRGELIPASAPAAG
jgi:two-component system, OmpR family, KDP operon response regulator KdpE